VRNPRFAFVFAAASVGSLAVVVALGTGTACSFSHDAAQPDTFVPEQDSVSDSDLVQLPIIAFDTTTSSEVTPDIDSCKGVPYDGGTPTDAPYDAGADGAAPGGEMIDVGLVMYQFGTGNTQVIPGAKVDVFFSDRVNGAIPDITGVVADDKGIAHVVAPAGWRIGYHIAETSDPDPLKALKAFADYDLQLPYVSGETVAAAGVTVAENATLTLAITNDSKYVPPPGTAIFAARVVDCQRRTLANATLELFDVDTSANVQLADGSQCKNAVPCRIYMGDAELPNFSLTWTSHAGLVVLPNLDASHHYLARAKGKRTGSPDVEEIGSRGVELQPGTIDVAYIYP
jgi:hypothetical protein